MAVSYGAEVELSKKASFDPSKQKTLKKPISISGIGLFTAESASLTIHPADPDTGILFQRTDLPGNPKVIADLDHVVSTPRCTILGNENCTIHTVEHVLAALSAMGIDNALLELSGPEVPIMDGSAEPFVDIILKGEIEELDKERIVHKLDFPVSWSQGEVHIVAIPSEELKISYTLQFPESEILHSQYLCAPITPEYFCKEIAPCRTFCLYEDIAPFIENGLIKGGGLDNAVIIKNDVVINPDGVRFSDEMVRHKILDLIGDLSLLAVSFCAHIIAIRSGHASNVAFAHGLLNQIKMEKANNGERV
ncbi:MAG: UDP-3-O-acyl-N-acetylglucosamine deacetylase [Chlamydiae bacterium]|nr:UDP-3-O-acyl-N-acetylglucosamine deacetylase [Chlamydiota bacterium]